MITMRGPVSCLMLLLAFGVARAQPPLFEPPQGFYKARGNPVAATWSVDRTTLPENESITATLTIAGATNPQDIVRPDLAKIREFADRFQIENVPGRSPTFAYKLRPRNAAVNRLPSMDFHYDSGVKVGNPFKNARAKGIDLVVTAVAKAKPQPVPLLEPDRFFEIESGSHVLEKQPFAAGWMAWLGLFLLGILIAAMWYIVWENLYPDGAKLAKLRRNRAMRRATDAIRRDDSAGAVAAAVIGYLRSRCPLPAGCETPSEVGEALRSANIPAADAAEEFLRRCDEARFAPKSDSALSLADEARSLLARMEAAT